METATIKSHTKPVECLSPYSPKRKSVAVQAKSRQEIEDENLIAIIESRLDSPSVSRNEVMQALNR